MRFYVKLSGNLDTGEGNITKSSETELEELIKASPLMAADFLKDWRGIIDSLYFQACAEMRKEFEEMRRNARKRGTVEEHNDDVS